MKNSLWTLPLLAAAILVAASSLVVAMDIDYAQDIGGDFSADYLPGPNLPQNNPFGPHSEWEFIGRNDAESSGVGSSPPASSSIPLTAASSLIGSGQNGWWVDQSLTRSPGDPGYGYFRSGWPIPVGDPLPPRAGGVAGHGFHEAAWTAPTLVDAGAVEISGWLEQLFEAQRHMQLRIFLNDEAEPRVLINAVRPPNNSAVTTTPVAFGPLVVPIEDPGFDKLTIFVDGAGPSGNGINTFTGWNLEITEIDFDLPTLGPGDYDGNGKVDQNDHLVWSAGFNSTEDLAADGNHDGAVNSADYSIWRDNLGAVYFGNGSAATTGAATGIPEPATLKLLLLASIGIRARPRRRRSRNRTTPYPLGPSEHHG